MATNISQSGSGSEYTWLRCANCNGVIWQQFASGRLVMRTSPRGGQHRIIVVHPDQPAPDVTCEKCATVWSDAPGSRP